MLTGSVNHGQNESHSVVLLVTNVDTSPSSVAREAPISHHRLDFYLKSLHSESRLDFYLKYLHSDSISKTLHALR